MPKLLVFALAAFLPCTTWAKPSEINEASLNVIDAACGSTSGYHSGDSGHCYMNAVKVLLSADELVSSVANICDAYSGDKNKEKCMAKFYRAIAESRSSPQQ